MILQSHCGPIHDIQQALYEFEGRMMGKEPTAIYMGRNTRRRFKADVNAHYHMRYNPQGPADRDRFDGIPIFVVDEEEHLNVG